MSQPQKGCDADSDQTARSFPLVRKNKLCASSKELAKNTIYKTLNLLTPESSRSKISKKGHQTFAIGHLALGYITGKATSKLLNTHINLPLVFTVALIADIDLLFPVVEHRGPSHSIIILSVIAIPIILIYKKRAIPYLIAFASHPLLGDYLTSPSSSMGVQLLYPLSATWFSAGSEAFRLVYLYIELILFASLLLLLLATKDIKTFVRPHLSNLLLIIPVLTAFLPVFTRFPIPVPKALIIPHLILLVLLATPIFIDIANVLKLDLKDQASSHS